MGDGDNEKHLIVIINGKNPNGWEKVNTDCMALLDDARERLDLTGEGSGRRGSFPSIGTGVSFGGGQTQPMNFVHKGIKGEVVDSLNQHPTIHQIAAFQSCEHWWFHL